MIYIKCKCLALIRCTLSLPSYLAYAKQSSCERGERVRSYSFSPIAKQRKHTDMAFLIECVGMNRIHDLIHRNITRYRDLESVFCPALDAKVHFTLKAWKHILGLEKGQKKRSRKEIEERLVLIMQSPRVLSMAQTYDEIRVQKGRTYYSFVFSDPNGSWIAVVMRDKERIFRLVSVFRRYKKQVVSQLKKAFAFIADSRV